MSPAKNWSIPNREMGAKLPSWRCTVGGCCREHVEAHVHMGCYVSI